MHYFIGVIHDYNNHQHHTIITGIRNEKGELLITSAIGMSRPTIKSSPTVRDETGKFFKEEIRNYCSYTFYGINNAQYEYYLKVVSLIDKYLAGKNIDEKFCFGDQQPHSYYKYNDLQKAEEVPYPDCSLDDKSKKLCKKLTDTNSCICDKPCEHGGNVWHALIDSDRNPCRIFVKNILREILQQWPGIMIPRCHTYLLKIKNGKISYMIAPLPIHYKKITKNKSVRSALENIYKILKMINGEYHGIKNIFFFSSSPNKILLGDHNIMLSLYYKIFDAYYRNNKIEKGTINDIIETYGVYDKQLIGLLKNNDHPSPDKHHSPRFTGYLPLK